MGSIIASGWYRMATLGLALGLAGLVSVVGADPVDANHSWSGLHWARTSNPFALSIGDNLTTAEWKSLLALVSSDSAANDWSDSGKLDTVVVVPGGTQPDTCAPTFGRVEACNADYGNNGWLGLASVWYYLQTKHIAQGTVKVNDFYFNQPAYDDVNAQRHVLCQEVGHTLGLGHNRNGRAGGTPDDTCMNDQAGLFDPAYVDPNSHDYAQLDSIYKHLDSNTSVSPASSGSGANRSTGQPTDAVPPGAGPQHGNVFTRDLGNGQAIVTFVIWASERGRGGAR